MPGCSATDFTIFVVVVPHKVSDSLDVLVSGTFSAGQISLIDSKSAAKATSSILPENLPGTGRFDFRLQTKILFGTYQLLTYPLVLTKPELLIAYALDKDFLLFT